MSQIKIHSLARDTPGQLVLPLAQIGLGEAGEIAELVAEFSRPPRILADDLLARAMQGTLGTIGL